MLVVVKFGFEGQFSAKHNRNKTAKLIMPSPPTCISVKMTHWPNKVNTFPVSTTPSPVTVQAETVVNKASSHEIDVVVAIGNFNKHVPIIDNIIKDKVRTREDSCEC